MFPHTDDPYEQPTLPYQPYIGPIDALVSRQQEIMSPSISSRAGASPRPAMPAMPARPVEPRMSKAEALEFIDECKRWLIAGSIVVFGILSGLVAAHVTGTTSNQATPASNAPSTSPSSGGGFFQQQQGGGYFGNGNSGNHLYPALIFPDDLRVPSGMGRKRLKDEHMANGGLGCC